MTKSNGTAGNLIKVIIIVAGFLLTVLGIVFASGKLMGVTERDIGDVRTVNVKQDDSIKTLQDETRSNKERIIRFEVGQEYIVKSLSKIDKKLDKALER